MGKTGNSTIVWNRLWLQDAIPATRIQSIGAWMICHRTEVQPNLTDSVIKCSQTFHVCYAKISQGSPLFFWNTEKLKAVIVNLAVVFQFTAFCQRRVFIFTAEVQQKLSKDVIRFAAWKTMDSFARQKSTV